MGLVRSAIVGPLVLYAALMGHTFCHMWLRTPDPLVAPRWTNGETQEQKDAVVAGRQELIKEIKQAVAGLHKKDFPKRRLTDDIVFEDFWMRYDGRQEFSDLIDSGEVLLSNVKFNMKGTHHGTDRIILEWDQIMDFYKFPWTVPVPMRVTTFLRKDGQGVERIYRYQEEWWGNVQLNRETTFMPLAVLHENLRRFTGILLHKIIVNFML